ncbi:gluconokinase [Agriterribacter sp.]|uniref:gluconokinase n=1 Tax=Agriterribacter sp. TaxID=2821509 RepID=UPI002C914C30|nr:gluconokinase [Agriterribacter sp.]HRO46653.1 gluconokinase [Agriterribacter sp.]HRQ17314.1 gluconokinase [Agriterribacter sp.]
MSIIIGADIGTSNIKVIAFKNDKEVLLSETASCTTIQPSSEKMEQDPELILQSVNSLLKKVLSQLEGKPVTGICFSTAMHSIIAIDDHNKPLTNAILWGDTRSMRQCNRLKENGMAEKLYRQTGVPLHPALPLCKIMWIKENEPGIFNRAHKFISLKEYFFFQWFEKYIIDHSIAGATGMQDIHRLQWSGAALQAAGIREEQLSRIVPVTHTETQLTGSYRKYFGIENIPFIIGSSDGCLANTGSGVFSADEAALTIGTSGAVRTTIPAPALNKEPTLFCYPLLEDVFIKGGAVNNGGNVLSWFAGNFMNQKLSSESDYALLVDQAHTVDAGANGLLFLPYLQGERAPIWDAAARGVFFGMNNLHCQPHFVRATLEGINYALYDVFCELTKDHDPVKTIYASGGFVQSAPWVQMVSDIFNKEVVISNQADASATGAALLGWYATGASKSFIPLSSSLNKGKTFYPNKEKHTTYMRQFAIFRSLYLALEKEFPRLHQ